MKLELNRNEMEQAIKCFINAQGIDLSNKTIKCTVGREIITVDITEALNDNVTSCLQPEENVVNTLVKESNTYADNIHLSHSPFDER